METLDKNTLRVRALGARKSIPADVAAAASEALAVHLAAMIPASAKMIAGYRAIHGEINVALVMEELCLRGHSLCLPVVVGEGQPLMFRQWKPGDALEIGAYGIEVPPSSAVPCLPDVVIVPLAAFDAEGYRLGYGAGYYDRTIPGLRAANPHIRLVGAAYSQQQVDQIPIDGHDQKLDAIVTEKGIVVNSK